MGRKDLVKEMKVDGCRLLGNNVEVLRKYIRVYEMVGIDKSSEGVVNGDAHGKLGILIKMSQDNDYMDNTVKVLMKMEKEAGTCMEVVVHKDSSGTSVTRNMGRAQAIRAMVTTCIFQE